MAITRKITQIGNSRGIILPQTVLEQLDWEQEQEVVLKVEGKKLVLTVRRPKPSRYATAEEFNKVRNKIFSKHRRLNERLAK